MSIKSFFLLKASHTNFFKKNISIKINKKIGINDPKNTTFIPVAKAVSAAIKLM